MVVTSREFTNSSIFDKENNCMNIRCFFYIVVMLFSWESLSSQGNPTWGTWEKWGAQTNGTYSNPVLPADFSDLDCIRVGDVYYAITSTFQYSPGMTVLCSKDLVNWNIIGHAVEDIRQIGPEMNWDKMDRYGRGIWAGSIRYHNGRFYVLFGTPDEGFFTTWATDPTGTWAPLTNILPEAGWDDCSALWDDDGQAYFIGTLFRDRAYESYLFKMTPDCSAIEWESRQLINKGDGREASKLLKVGNWYYIIYSRTGGGSRYMVAKRAKSMQGPWSDERQLTAPNIESHQPNQGGIVEGPNGKWYFFTHHGKGDWEGRAASLLPVVWSDGWPIIGKLGDDGLGYMVWSGEMPLKTEGGKKEHFRDDFKKGKLHPEWEWNYYPRDEMWSLSEKKGWLRMRAVKPIEVNNLKKVPNILTQRVYRVSSNEVVVKIDLRGMSEGQMAGLCHYARTYAYIGILLADGKLHIVYNEDGKSRKSGIPATKTIWLRSVWGLNGVNRFSYSTDGRSYSDFGDPYQFTWGNYRGTKVGVFTFNESREEGYVDVDYFEYNKNNKSKT